MNEQVEVTVGVTTIDVKGSIDDLIAQAKRRKSSLGVNVNGVVLVIEPSDNTNQVIARYGEKQAAGAN